MMYFSEFSLDSQKLNTFWLGAEFSSGTDVQLSLELLSAAHEVVITARGTTLDQYATSLIGLFTFLFAN